MNYIFKEFIGICPKTNQNKTIKIAYFQTSTLKSKNYLQKSHSLCKCDLDCPIVKETPNKIEL